jgi:uncharacterized protein (UPF0332 family)
MFGRAFLDSARDLLARPSEANWRSAAGRAYYALIHEGRAALDRWGFPLPPHESIHRFVHLHISFANNPDLRRVSHALGQLSRLRNEADYRLASAGSFASGTRATQAVDEAQDAIDLLDQVEADPARRAAAVAAIQASLPPPP